MLLLSFILFAFAAFCHGVVSRYQHEGFKFKNVKFWSADSWRNKYKSNGAFMDNAPNNWYYRFFKIDYKEKFPLSATLLVFLTDGYHFTQWIMIKCLALSIALLVPHHFIFFFSFWALWTVCFQLTYIFFKKVD